MAQCYRREGTEAYHTVCSPDESISFCCPDAFECYANGLCAFGNSTSMTRPAIGNLTYQIDVIEATEPSCTDKNWGGKCANAPVRCEGPNDTDCYPNSIGYLPLQGCTPEVEESFTNPSLWLSCGCYDHTCTAAEEKYHKWGPLGAVICPAWRRDRNLTEWCTPLPTPPYGNGTIPIINGTYPINSTQTSLPSATANLGINAATPVREVNAYRAQPIRRHAAQTTLVVDVPDTYNQQLAVGVPTAEAPSMKEIRVVPIALVALLLGLTIGLLLRRYTLKRQKSNRNLRELSMPPRYEGVVAKKQTGN
ncbi:hypothetical protein EJ08DRAFT_656790 [Tothia fuscella]|uniref:Uncharacterized protein n=1 Tax=Tothia fuscella TaxID=1048955 RepID=A0A9P4NZ61_9PEZI|nr:hypothetical protein EJ08DRAFT_656790 [Tothia fuscella]